VSTPRADKSGARGEWCQASFQLELGPVWPGCGASWHSHRSAAGPRPQQVARSRRGVDQV